MSSAAAVFLTIIVFLIVFFVSWGLHVRVVSALALASVISILFMYLAYPPVAILVNLRDAIASPGWVIIYWILHLLFIFYIFVYVVYMAVYDTLWGNRHADKCPNLEFIQKMKGEGVVVDEDGDFVDEDWSNGGVMDELEKMLNEE